MLFTGCEVRMRKTVPGGRRARDVFKTEGTVFLIRTDAAGMSNVYIFYHVKIKFIKIPVLLAN
jgi:hypothetical protein